VDMQPEALVACLPHCVVAGLVGVLRVAQLAVAGPFLYFGWGAVSGFYHGWLHGHVNADPFGNACVCMQAPCMIHCMGAPGWAPVLVS